MNIGEDTFSISPAVLYQINNDITLSNTVTFDHMGTINNALGVSYNLKASKGASVILNTRFSNLNTLEETILILVLNY